MNNTDNKIRLEHAKIEVNHLKEIKIFRILKSEIETLIDELKNKSKSINWKYLEEIYMKNDSCACISDIETYHKIFALDFIKEKLKNYDKILIKNIENIVEEHQTTLETSETLCEMNSLNLTMKNYDSDSLSDETEDEGYPLIRTHGRTTLVHKKRYNLRSHK